MGNPEKGPGKLGHEGKGNEKPNVKTVDPKIVQGLGKTAVKGSQGR